MRILLLLLDIEQTCLLLYKLQNTKTINSSIFRSSRHSSILSCCNQKLEGKKMKLEMAFYLLVLCKCVCSFENGDLQRMSLASDGPNNGTTFIRYKRYLDFIPKSRMFVSLIKLKILPS